MNNDLSALDNSAVSTCFISFNTIQGGPSNHIQTLETSATCSVYSKHEDTTSTHSLMSAGSFSFSPIRYTQSSTTVSSDAYTDLRNKDEHVHALDDLNSSANVIATHRAYIGRYLNAFFKHKSAQWPFHVIGYYNNRIVLSTFKPLEVAGFENIIKSDAYAMISRTVDMPKVIDSAHSDVESIQIKVGEVLEARVTQTLLSDAVSTHTLFIHHKKLVDIQETLTTDAGLALHVKGESVYDNNETLASHATTDYFAIGPFAGQHEVSSQVPSIQIRVKDANATHTVEVQTYTTMLLEVDRVPTRLLNVEASSYADLSISPFIILPHRSNELITKANTNMFALDTNVSHTHELESLGTASFVRGLVSSVSQTHEVVSSFYTGSFKLDHTIPHNTISLNSYAQTDLRTGDNIYVSREESLSSAFNVTTHTIEAPDVAIESVVSFATLETERNILLNIQNQTNSAGDTSPIATHQVSITLDKQNGTGGTDTITTFKDISISPTTLTTPTRTYYNLMGYYDEAFVGERQYFVISMNERKFLATGIRHDLEGDIYTGDRMHFLQNLYANSIYWRFHFVIKSKKPVTAINISGVSILHDLIDVSTSSDYTYILDTSATSEICNNSTNGQYFQYLTVKTTDDKNSDLYFVDTWAYVSATPLTQRISSTGEFLQLNSNTFTNNKTLYAQWASDKGHVYWVSYSSGTVGHSMVVYEGYSNVTPTTVYAPPNTPSTAQYTYTWARDSYTLVTDIEPNAMIVVSERRTLNKYTITWKDYYGETLKTETLDYGLTSSAPTGTTNNAQYSYAWPKSSTFVEANEIIQETRTINTYTVTWINYAGDIVKVDTRNYGAPSNAPANTPDTLEYEYSWPSISVLATSDKVITENRSLVVYTVQFINYENNVVSTQFLNYNQTPTVPDGTPNTQQYTYNWPAVSSVSSSVSYKETRTVNQYTIAWITYDGTTVKTETLDYGSVSVAPLGTPDNEYWDYQWPNQVTVTEDITINESRVGQLYTITFDANGGGTPSTTTRVIRYGHKFASMPTSTWSKHKLLGWFTSINGGDKVTSGTSMLTPYDHTLYAHWNPTEPLEDTTLALVSVGASDIRVGDVVQISRTEQLSSTADLEYFNQTVFHITLDNTLGEGGTTEISGSTGLNINPTTIVIPSKTNYTFEGYYSASSGGVKYINADGTFNNLDSNTFVGNVTLYAQWTINQVQFVFNNVPNNIGTTGDMYFDGVRVKNNTSGANVFNPANTVFKVNDLKYPVGWKYKQHTTSALIDVVIGGSENTTEVQGVGDMSTTSVRMITMTAEGIVYSVSMQQNGGAGSYLSSNIYQPSTSITNITLTRGSRTDYRFHQWTVSGGNNQVSIVDETLVIPAYTKTVQPYGDVVVTANWLPASASTTEVVSSQADCQMFASNVITITLDKQTGTGGTSSIASVLNFYLDPTSIVPPSKTGYSFTGYFTSSSNGTKRIDATGLYINLANYTYTVDTTLYAQWSLNTYTITHDANGGVGGTPSFTYTYHTQTHINDILEDEPTRVGYTHVGYKWVSNSIGKWVKNTVYDAQYEIVNTYGSGTLQSQWQANQYVLTLNHNAGAGSTLTNVSVTYDSNYGTLLTPTRTGYTFLGWFTSAVGGNKIQATTKVTTASNHTFYAHWKPVVVTQTLLNSVVTNATGEARVGKIKQANHTTSLSSFSTTATLANQHFEVSDIVSLNTYATFAYINHILLNNNTHLIESDGASDMRVGNVVQISKTELVASLGEATAKPVKTEQPISISEVVSNATFTYENQTAFVITLNKQSGLGGTSTISGLTGVSITPTSVTVPTRAGYNFQGYYTATIGGTKRINANGTFVSTATLRNSVGNVTLYARWQSDGGMGQL